MIKIDKEELVKSNLKENENFSETLNDFIRKQNRLIYSIFFGCRGMKIKVECAYDINVKGVEVKKCSKPKHLKRPKSTKII